MGRYDPQRLGSAIESYLSEPDDVPPPEEADVREALAAPSPSPVLEAVKLLRESIIPEMQALASVDRPRYGTRLALVKQALLIALRPLSRPQAHYNYQAIRALETVANQLAEIQRQIGDEQELPGTAAGEGTLSLRTLSQRLEQAREETSALLEGLVASTDRVDEVADTIQELHREFDGVRSDIRSLEEKVDKQGDQMGEILKQLDALSARDDELSATIDAKAGAIHEQREKDLDDVYRNIRGAERRAEEVHESLASSDETNARERGNLLDGIRQLQDRVGEMEGRLREADAKILFATEFRSQVLDLMDRIERGEVSSAPTPSPGAPDVPPAPVVPSVPSAAGKDSAYLQFQRKFRGDEKILRERQREYIAIVRAHLQTGTETPAALDLACGDGLFVEILKDEGFEARGVDLNTTMVNLARERELPVEQGDALEAIARAEPASLDVVTTFQFVEHLTEDQFHGLLHGVRRALKPGGVFVVETLNPNTLMAMKWFHLDLTHQHLIYPELLATMAENLGMTCVEWKGIHPVEAHRRLSVPEDSPHRDNAERLNEFLFGDQDYYLVARKPAGS